MKTAKPTLLLVTLLVSCIAQLAAGYYLVPAGNHLVNGFAFAGVLFTISALALVGGDWMRAHLASLPIKS